MFWNLSNNHKQHPRPVAKSLRCLYKILSVGSVIVLPVFISFLLSQGIGCWSCSKALLMLSNVYIWNSFKFSKWYFSILNVLRHIFTFLHFSTWTYIYSYHKQKESSLFLIICWSFVNYLTIQGSNFKQW